MRIPLIIGGVVVLLVATLLALTVAVVGFSSPAKYLAQAGARWQMAAPTGFFGAVSDVWLWGRCVRATGLSDNPGIQRSYLTDAERNCGKSALKRAESLVVAKGDRVKKELAIKWYQVAETLSVPDDFSAQVAYSNRILSSDIPTNLLPGMDPNTARSGAVLTILIAAWHDDSAAMIRATDLLLEGSTPAEEFGLSREIEAYALLLQAKAKGQNVDERLGLVSLLLEANVRFEIQDWLKATGRLPA